MTHASSSRLLLFLVAALLLAGQGSALHHHHRSVADCPAGPCLEHGGHAAPAGGESVSPDDTCPFCESLGQARTALPAPEAGFTPARPTRLSRPGPGARAHAAPALPGAHARAPPRSA